MNFAALDAYLESTLAYGFPFYDLSVHVRGREVYRRRGGNIGAPDTRYFLYSCSKPITCAAALILLERGAFYLDTPVSAFLPEFADVQVAETVGGETRVRPAKKPMLMRHLFTMTAGLDYDLDTPAIRAAVDATGGRAPTREIARAIAQKPLNFDPGERWQYSLCHDVLAAAVEVAAGMKFRDFVQKEIFAPLGMTRSGYTLPADMGEIGTQYVFDDTQHRAVETEKKCRFILGTEYDSGGAGVIASLEDYVKFADAMANGGVGATGATGAQILSAATIDLMRENALTEEQRRQITWGQLAGYGYGLGVRTMVNRAEGGSIGPLGEFGWGGAAGSLLYLSPEEGVAICYAQHTLNPHQDEVMPTLRNVVFAALGK